MPTSPGGTEYDDDELDTLFRAIGIIVVQWGQAEQSLDLVITMIYQDLGGRALARRQPKMLEEKLKFLEHALGAIPALHKFREVGRSLIAEFRRLGAVRHDLIHGAIASVRVVEGAFLFNKLDHHKDGVYGREVRLEASEFDALVKSLIALGGTAAKFGQSVLALTKK